MTIEVFFFKKKKNLRLKI